MRKTELAVVGFALFLFFLVGPLTANRGEMPSSEIQREEAREEQVAEPFDEDAGERYRVLFRSSSMKENEVADILWLKKAAEVALDAGIPHFNVKERKITKQLNRKLHRRMSVVEGVIELDNDPMSAEHNAHEILSLVLPEMIP